MTFKQPSGSLPADQYQIRVLWEACQVVQSTQTARSSTHVVSKLEEGTQVRVQVAAVNTAKRYDSEITEVYLVTEEAGEVADINHHNYYKNN